MLFYFVSNVNFLLFKNKQICFVLFNWVLFHFASGICKLILFQLSLCHLFPVFFIFKIVFINKCSTHKYSSICSYYFLKLILQYASIADASYF